MGYRVKRTNAWPGGIIPYEFKANVPQNVVELVKACMGRWEQFVNEGKQYVRFVERTNEEFYIQVLRDDAGSTGSGDIGKPPEGKKFNQFTLNLSHKGLHPEDEKSIPHELGHVLGLAHEHQRSRVADEAEANDHSGARLYYLGQTGKFDKKFQPIPQPTDKANMHAKWDENYETVGSYDIQSIMHYPDAANWQWNYAPYRKVPDAIEGLNYPSLETVLAGKWEPSPGDVQAVRDLYTNPNP